MGVGLAERLEREGICCCCSVAQSCLTLCDPVDCSTPGVGGGGIYVHTELTHIVLQQKLMQRCKAILLQFLKLNLIFFLIKKIKEGPPTAT